MKEYQQRKYDLLLMDIYMGGMTGVEVVTEVRKIDETLIVAFITSSADHTLEIIIMTIIAVVAGGEHWTEIADYCKSKKEWFQQVLNLELKNGVPIDDTFQRIFAIIKLDELEKSFVSWVKAINELTQGEIVSIDGKTICGSRDQQDHVIHMVSACANQARTSAADVRSNEITAIPELLDRLELKGCIITADAVGCQKKIVENIVSHECDYVL